MRTKLFILTVWVLSGNTLLMAQTDESTDKVAKATEYSIPSSGAFSLLGVNPSVINRPGFTKDIDVSSFVKDGKILSNLALEANPMWLFYLNKKEYRFYRDTLNNFTKRFLSRLNVSIGTADQNNQRQLAYSVKYTFFKDPLTDKSYIDSLEGITVKANKKYAEDFNNLLLKLIRLDPQSETFESDSIALQNKISDLQKEKLAYLDVELKEKKLTAKDYIETHWASPMLDIGLGELKYYDSPKIDSLRFSTSGFGVWINGSVGFSPKDLAVKSKYRKGAVNKVILAGLFKWTNVNNKDNVYLGVNVRYGSYRLNLFAEYLYQKINDVEYNALVYGGHYKIDYKRAIEFSIRTVYDSHFTPLNIVPTFSANFNFGKDELK